MAIDPVLRSAGQALGIQFPCRQKDLVFFAVNPIASHMNFGKGIIVSQSLMLMINIDQQFIIPNGNVSQHIFHLGRGDIFGLRHRIKITDFNII